MLNAPTCKRFTGYKPCFPYHNCILDGCKECIPMGKKILIINLDAMGDVIMTTARLKELKRKYPVSTIHWVTLKLCSALLENNPLIDRVFNYDFESISILQNIKYDVLVNLDKSLRAASLANIVSSQQKMGFGLDENGKIIPFNEGAEYNYRLGMDDFLKFRVNKKTKQEYVSETMEIDYVRDEYVFSLKPEELEFVKDYKKSIGIAYGDCVVGINTGCSEFLPNKKLSIKQHIDLIEKLLAHKELKIVLFGGPEDKLRNKEIYSHFGDRIISTPIDEGVRKGACYEAIADVVITGDSFGMHLAIAMQKYIIVWFGLSCWTEIDLYDRGVMLIPEGLECAPCWNRTCPHNLECREMVDLDKIVLETLKYFGSVSKQNF